MDRIMLVDEDSRIRGQLERLLIDFGYRVTQVDSCESLLDLIKQVPFDLVIMENLFSGFNKLEMLERVRSIKPKLPIIILSSTARTEDVIKASKLGAFDYIQKPFSDSELLRLVGQALEAGRFTRHPVRFAQDPDDIDDDNLVGQSQPMKEIYKAIGRVAPTDATVLIRGESGTGKELVARAICHHSKRVERPFVVVNCVAIPENLLESELFGYEKGAFSGANRQRIGKIEYADKGTLLLDEIGDIPLSIQAKLLRLLQERSIERIGGKQPIQIDVRILAATNADLEAKIKDGRFRQDLYYRINVVSLTLPPLRERAEDISLLADYFLAKHSKNLDVRNPGILPEAKNILESYDWPGNVRELANTIEKCLIFSKGRPVDEEEVLHLFSETETEMDADAAAQSLDASVNNWVRKKLKQGQNNLLESLTEHVERLTLVETLTACNGNRSLAARRLGISRPTLLKKIRKFGLLAPPHGRPGK